MTHQRFSHHREYHTTPLLSPRKRREKRAILLIALIALLLLAGCGGSSAHKPQGGKLRITTTVGMVTDIVARVAGDEAVVTGLMGPGVDPHLYKASYRDVTKLDRADIVFYSGLHLEGKMTGVLEKMGRFKPVIAVAEAIPESLRMAKAGERSHTDPHVWMDPSLWKHILVPITDELCRMRPEKASLFRARADSLATQFDSLAAWAQRELATIPKERRVLVTAHDAFNYFGKAFDVEVRGLQGISTATDFGLADVQNLASLITERKIKAVFVESSVPQKPLQAVIEGCRARGQNVLIGGLLYSDAMGASGTDDGTYFGMIRHNVNTIVSALQ